MFILYSILVSLTFLSGCSWFTKKATISPESYISQVHKPVGEKTVEVVDTSDVTVTQEAKPKRRRRRRRRASQPIKELSVQKNTKTLADIKMPVAEKQNIEEESTSLLDFFGITSSTDAKKSSVQKRTLTICNAIEEQQLKVKHWSGTYKPTTLTIKVNDKEFDLVENKKIVNSGDTQLIELTDNTVTVEYYYEFMNGYRTGGDTVEFIADDKNESLNMTFNWDTKWHVEFDNAQPIWEK